VLHFYGALQLTHVPADMQLITLNMYIEFSANSSHHQFGFIFDPDFNSCLSITLTVADEFYDV